MVQGNSEILREYCNIGKCDRWNTTAELEVDCANDQTCWGYTTRRVGGLGGKYVPECMKSCQYNGGAAELYGKYPSWGHNIHRKVEVLCGARSINVREIEAYDDAGHRVRAVGAEFSTGQSDLLQAGQAMPTHEAGSPAKNCIDGDLDPYIVKHPAWGVQPALPYDVSNGASTARIVPRKGGIQTHG